MGFFKSLGKTLGKVGKGVGKGISKVGNTAGKVVSAPMHAIENISGIFKPGNFLLIGGVVIVAIITLPKLLDTKAADNASRAASDVAAARVAAK